MSALQANVNAGGDALAYTAGAISASLVQAAGQASLVALTQIASSTVEGDLGAFALAGSDMTVVNVVSSAGDARAISTGSIASSLVDGALSATVVTVGELSTSTLIAGGDVAAVSKGDTLATIVNAGGAATLASYGRLQLASLIAGGAVTLASVGDLTAHVQAGGALEAGTFGALDGTYTAATILALGARGDLTGTYTSLGNIESVISYGSIQAELTAGLFPSVPDPNDPTGANRGHIRSIRAWDDVAGTITAERSIGDIYAGGTVTATLTAPSIGTLHEHDRTQFSGWPEPRPGRFGELVTAVVDLQHAAALAHEELVHDLTAQQRAVNAIRNALLADLADALQQLAEVHTEATDRAANEAAYRDRELAQMLADAVRLVAAFQHDVDDGLRSLQVAEAMLQKIVGAQLVELAHLDNGLLRTALNHKAQRLEHAAILTAAASALNVAIINSVYASNAQANVAFQNLSRELAFMLDPAARIEKFLNSVSSGDLLDDAANLVNGWGDKILPFDLMKRYRQAMGWDFTDYDSVLYKLGGVLGTVHSLALSFAGGAACGSGWAYTAARGYGQFMTVAGMAESAYRFSNGTWDYWDVLALAPAAGWGLGRIARGLGLLGCFVGDTEVVIGFGPQGGGTWYAAGTPVACDASSTLWAAGVGSILVGLGGVLMLERHQRRQDRRQQRALVDAALADDDLIDGRGDRLPELLPHLSREEFETLCDRLFSTDDGADSVAGSLREPEPAATSSTRVHGACGIRERHSPSASITAKRTHVATVRRRPGEASKPARRPRSRWRSAVVWLVPWLLVAAGCLGLAVVDPDAGPSLAGPEASAHSQAAALAPVSRDSQPKYLTRKIRDIRNGQRVLADNPELEDWEVPPEDIRPDTHRNMVFRQVKPDGSLLDFELIRSLEWIDLTGAAAGQSVELDLAEFGVEGAADVLEIQPCPPLEEGPGRLVTGIFRHTANNVIDVHVEGMADPIGVTANHPFWSQDRQSLVPASVLYAGEHLLRPDGTLCRVARLSLRPRTEIVFNLEVDGEHVYYVSPSGILVHNSCASGIYAFWDLKRGGWYVGMATNLRQRLLQHVRAGRLASVNDAMTTTVNAFTAKGREARRLRALAEQEMREWVKMQGEKVAPQIRSVSDAKRRATEALRTWYESGMLGPKPSGL